MKIRFDLFKEGSGKWAYGGEVEIPDDLYIWSDGLIPSIIENQTHVVTGAFDHEQYYMVTDDAHENQTKSTYHRFFKAMFKPHQVTEGYRRWATMKEGEVVI